MYKSVLVLLILSLTMFLSCSDNSTDSGDLQVDGGVGSFNVTGDLEASNEGASYFTVLKNDGNLLGIRIHIVEAHPLDRDDSYDPTYTLTLIADRNGEPISLSKGTYDFGTLSDDNLMFAGIYTHRISADVINAYQHQNGTITITSYSDKLIEASFELSATDFGEGATSEEDKVISISGEFSAECYGVTC